MQAPEPSPGQRKQEPFTTQADSETRRDKLHESPASVQGLNGPGPTGQGASRPTLKLDPPDVEDENLGTRISYYKLLERIGEGGCGAVYVAEQTEPVRRRVALKVIKLGMDTKQVVARFEAERQALAMMDHPNIAKVLDGGSTETGRPYFVMELVRGMRLTDYCDQNQLPTKERLELFIQICHAIQHAHQKGIIHRDIKPSNILVTLHGGVPVPMVIDFGIAKATEGRLTDATVYTQLHQFIGTPAYMSPEQAEMSGLDVDTRSDIYSLGVLLYELLTGRTPFDAQELMSQGIDAMRKTIREREPMRPSTKLATLKRDELTTTAKRRGSEAPKLISLLRGDLDWIAMKCLEKDRTHRYETANGLAVDIKRHLANEPVVARPPSTVYRLQKALRRHKVGFAMGVAIVLTLVVGALVSTWQALEARRAQRQTEEARIREQQQRVQAQEAQRAAEAQRARADVNSRKASESEQQSRRLLYDSDMNLAQQAIKLNNLGLTRRLLDRHRPEPGEEDLRGWEWRYLWQLTRSSALVTLTNRPVRGSSVGFSANGKLLAVGWWDGHINLWDVPSRRWVRTLTDQAYSHAGRVAFSPVRNVLVATSAPGTVTHYDLDAGRESVLWRAPDEGTWMVRDLSFSKDGSRLVLYAGSDRKARDQVSVVNLATGQIERREATPFSDTMHHGAARLAPDNQRLYVSRSDADGYRYTIQCLDADGKEVWQTQPEKDYGLTTMDISPDGRLLVSGSGFEDPTIRVWEASTGRLLQRLEGHTSWVSKVAFSSDGQRLVSAATDQSIRFWDASTWTETQVLRGHSDEVQAVAASESARLVASTGKDGKLLLWEDDGRSVADGYQRLPGDARRAQVLAMTNSQLLVLRPGNGPEVLDLRYSKPSVPLPEPEPAARVLGAFDPSTVCWWNGTNRILVCEVSGAQSVQRAVISTGSATPPVRLVFNATRQLLAWAEASASSVSLVNLSAPDRRIELGNDARGFLPVKFSEDGSLLAAATPNQDALRIWDVESGGILASAEEGANDTAFAANGRVVVTTVTRGVGHEVVFFDLANPGRSPRRVPGKEFSQHMAVSPDGNLVAVSTYGGLVRLFDPAKGELIESLHGHSLAAFGVAFSPDGRRLISAGGGREAIILWDVATRQTLLTLSGTGSFLHEAAWAPDGDVILAGRPWQAWRAPSWEEIAAAEAKEKTQ